MASRAEDEPTLDASSQQAEKAPLYQFWREDSSLQYFREEFWFRMSITPRLKTLPLHCQAENGGETLLCAQHHAERLWGQSSALSLRVQAHFPSLSCLPPAMFRKLLEAARAWDHYPGEIKRTNTVSAL